MHIAMCDVSEEAMEQTQALCEREAPRGTRVSATKADVSDEAQVLAFRDAVARDHRTDHIHLLFNNAGIGAAGSFMRDGRDEWEKTFAVCWYGVYYCSRAFVPCSSRARKAHLINTSSVNGFWASLGPDHRPHLVQLGEVRGEGIHRGADQRLPHERAAREGVARDAGTHRHLDHHQLRAHPRPRSEGDARRSGRGGAREHPAARLRRVRSDHATRSASCIQLRAEMFRDQAPMSAAQAAQVILDGVREERWRILVGEDATSSTAWCARRPRRPTKRVHAALRGRLGLEAHSAGE
jgi:NAD(P)-dependent dehydrogenase (short-subunit alcohol dehydrogenase family)